MDRYNMMMARVAADSAASHASASKEQRYEESLAEDLGEDFRLPMNHRPSENLVTDNLEISSVDTQISSNNVGFRLLQKMGWKGKGLGRQEQGIVEPIKAGQRDAKLGVGKQEEDDFYTAEENVQRKKLDVEVEETEEIAKKREAGAERDAKIREEVQEIQRPFYCQLCSKQYKLATEYETHLSSYDHNHKKRFKDMKEQQGKGARDDRLRRQELQQQKELSRQAAQAEAQRAIKQQQAAANHAASLSASGASPAAAAPPQDRVTGQEAAQRGALKFGFGARGLGGKVSLGSLSKKAKVDSKVAAIFKLDSDDES